ncbi:MAG: DUF1934 family protein [Clostridiales bacterium]|nr:DUF1934 family protein [Clostridiales bacterium]
MKCKVVLCGEEKTQNFSCIGELNLGEKSFSLSYVFNGDSCRLSYDGQLLRHQRQGEIPVLIEFDLNKRTLCKIGSGEFSGLIPVLTHSLNVQTGAKTASVSVVYELDGEDKKMQIIAESM